MNSLFDKSCFCWAKAQAPSRNQFVSFLREFDYQNTAPLQIHLFADTRYRLFVNETLLAYGPARFVTQFTEFDSFDLTPHLKPGSNRIRVEVNYYGTSSFQSMPDGQPGFIAAGGTEDGVIDLTTPGEWRAIVHRAWDAQSPLFSFAQNPCEILNTLTLASERTTPETCEVIPLPESSCPWTTLRPRSAPYPDDHPLSPVQLRLAAPADDAFHRIGLRSTDPEFHSAKRKGPGKLWFQLAGWIHSLRAREVDLESFWSTLEINGQSAELEESTLQGNHGIMHVSLREGWNFLAAEIEQLTEHWSFLLGWPRGAGLSMHARPDREEPSPWAVSPLRADSQSLPSSIPEDWAVDHGDLSHVTPARQTAWERPDESRAVRHLPWDQRGTASTLRCATAIWTLDFQDQFYGQPVIEVEAPAGSVLDLAYDDWIRSDDCVHLYNSNPFTDAADRFILQGGRQRIEVLNPRGGIFLQVVLRSPEGEPADLTLHDMNIRSRQTLAGLQTPEAFHSGDKLLDWTWHTAIHTLAVSTDEAYNDCPWRERGSYIGDSLVNLHLHRLLTCDLSIARRTLRLMGEGQHLDGPRKGQLASVTPAWHRQGHDDFTLIWILALRDYWALTGDSSLTREMWPVIQRIWDSPVWTENEYGLWDITDGMTPFIDWGVRKEDRSGRSNLVMNLFRVGALRATAELARTLDQNPDPWNDTADQVSTALISRLWREERGRFAASEEDDNSPCLHGQTLALLYDVGESTRLLHTIEPELRNNFTQGLEQGQNSGHLELYFHIYLLPALERLERHDLAEDFIFEHFKFLKRLGHPTLNECFCRAELGDGSCCHSWSGYAAVYATRNILGLRQATPGDPDRWLFAPRTARTTAASGILPHPRGEIRVSWTQTSADWTHHIQTPPGVECRPFPLKPAPPREEWISALDRPRFILHIPGMQYTSVASLSRHIGQTVALRGWVRAMRSSGKIRFIEFRDGGGDCQCTVEAARPEAFAAFENCPPESSVELVGSVREDPRGPGCVEVSITSARVVHAAEDFPIARKEHGVDFLMRHRHLWLRSPRQNAILRIRHRVISAAREFFDLDGFTLIDTPIFQPGAAEGAGTLFEVDYFGDPAYLAQTGQLYLETAAMAMGKVYCFGPTFRAEKSKTRRHLTEFWMIEPEVAFAELEDLERLAERFLEHVVRAVLDHNRADLDALERDTGPLEAIQAPFPRLTYSRAVDFLRDPELHAKLEEELDAERERLQTLKADIANHEGRLAQVSKAWKVEKLTRELNHLRDRARELERWIAQQPAHIEDARAFEWGRDFGGDEETILSQQFDRPLIVTDYPRDIKAFYMKPNPDDPRTVRNLDVLAPEGYGEIIGGSQREDDLDALLARMREENMDPAPYEWYLDLRRYGSVPHGGFGLGVERAVAWICGLKHIRETIPFPRLMGRMTP